VNAAGARPPANGALPADADQPGGPQARAARADADQPGTPQAHGPRRAGGDSTAAAPVQAEGLAKTYRSGTRAVRGLDLEIRPGEIFGLLGPNGAGKTTTIGMLTTRIRPTGGRARVGGADLSDTVAVKRAIGVVSQTNTLDRALSVRKNLLAHGWYFGLRSNEARAAADLLLEVFQLTDWADRKVRELSGGTAQRLMLARAVMHRPAVLFLDEPTAGLDPQSRLDAWDQLEQLHRIGQTILLTTHAMEEADRLCDRIAIVDHGQLLTLDTPGALKARHGGGTEVSLAVTGDVEALARRLGECLAGTLTGAPRVDPGAGSVSLVVDRTDDVVSQVLRLTEETGARILDLAVGRPSLERVFLNLTGRSLAT
jgi:ABC-2 type transport system ATP-binding protein